VALTWFCPSPRVLTSPPVVGLDHRTHHHNAYTCAGSSYKRTHQEQLLKLQLGLQYYISL
jgi:hypothetical protein